MRLPRQATSKGTLPPCRLAPEPVSVPLARQAVCELLRRNDREDLLEPIRLLVSEVVTNALLQAATEIEVAATIDESGIRVQVADGSAPPPTRDDATGVIMRSSTLLAALVDQWGVEQHGSRKTVWFHLSADHSDLAGVRPRPSPHPS